MPFIKYLRQTELRQFFSVITDARDLALFATTYYYGLRVSEITLLKYGDVDFCQNTILIRRVKKGKGGLFPLYADTATLLKQYLLTRRPTSDALFTGRQGSLCQRRVQQLFKVHARKVGLDEVHSVKSLRHSIATHLLTAGMDIADIQVHLGHAHISSTKVYAQMTDKRRLATHQAIEENPAIVRLSFDS